MSYLTDKTCGLIVDGQECGKPAVDHASIFHGGAEMRIFLCADHSGEREEIENMTPYD